MVWTLTNLRTSVDMSDRASEVKIADRAYAETSRLTAQIDDEAGTLSLLNEDEIVIMDGALKAFQGYARIVDKGDRGVSTQRVYTLECQDYTTALGDDVADTGAVRTTVESDKARIAWLGSTFGTRGVVFSGSTIVQLRASMPEQDFTGKNLHECLTMICQVTGGSFYVDYDKVLHYFDSEVLSAPFGLSDDPNGSTTFGYEGLRYRTDSVAYVNAVWVTNEGDISLWRYLGGSPPAAGTRRAAVVRDPNILTTADAEAVGDAVLAQYGSNRTPSQLVTYRPGLRAGMTVQVTHAGYGLSAQAFRITAIEASPVDRDRIAYTVFFGANPVSIEQMVAQTDRQMANVVAVAGAASAAASAVNDLSAGGGNIVPNSSFEDASSWVPGTSWTVGFDPVSPQEAFHGSKVARWAPSATQATLQSPLLPVARSDSYFFSAWVFCRAFTSGRLRVMVEEYNASDVLLATTVVGEVAAVSSEWQRVFRKFAPAPGVGVTGWQTTTAKVRIVFGPQGTNSTGTWDVDGVQGERGGLLTAYAPRPQELVAGAITATEISDGAVTTPKVAALAIVAGKIGAGAIGAAEIQANVITSDKLAVGGSGSIQMDEDGIYINVPGGLQAILTAGGFEGPWRHFIRHSFYNGDFVAGATSDIAVSEVSGGDSVADYAASLSPNLPYWVVETSGGNLRVVTDATASGGKALKSDQTAASQSSIIYQDIPVVPGRRYFVLWHARRTLTGSGTASLIFDGSFRNVDHSLHTHDANAPYNGGAFANASYATYGSVVDEYLVHQSGLIPPGVYWYRARLQISHGVYSAGVNFSQIWIDSVSLAEVTHVSEEMIGAVASGSGSQAATSGTWKVIQLGTTDHSYLPGMHPFTADIAKMGVVADWPQGWWQVDGSIEWASLASGSTRRIGLGINGATPTSIDQQGEFDDAIVASALPQNITRRLLLSAGDYVQLMGHANANVNIIAWRLSMLWLGQRVIR